jgi:hypothetical protein
MIVARIFGGLGNQMFQYAAGRALALRHRTELALDLRAFESYTLHRYALSRLRIEARVADAAELRHYGRRKLALISRLPLGRVRRYHVERTFGARAGWARVPADAYLSGYFQSEFFFAEAAERLRHEFLPVAALGRANEDALALIAGCESVALHVRRGDYVSDKATLDIHGACSAGYYRQAVELMRERVRAPRFFVLSNDLDWARQNVALPGDTVFVDWNASSPELDLHLMSRCRHHVIANSTFSWWGAWLASHPGQVVIAPRPWFDSRALDDSGVLPPRWTRIDKDPRGDVGRAD